MSPTATRSLVALAIAALGAGCVTKPESERPRSTASAVEPAPSAPPASTVTPTQAAGPVPTTTPPPATAKATAPSWRTESSLGVQIEVPSDWAVNDYGCNMSDRPSVVRAQGAVRMCLTLEQPTKQVALIEAQSAAAKIAGEGLVKRQVSLAGVSAERSEARGKDGRYLGWLHVASRGVTVTVKVLDPELRRRILDSAKLVSVDQNGCADQRPVAKRPDPRNTSPGSALVPAAPSALSVCYYGEGARLQASARLDGARASELAAALNKAPAGPNPDADPKQCLHPATPPPPDAVLLAAGATAPTTVYVAFSGCVGRGLDNGARRAQVTASIVKLVMTPLGTGYAMNGDLPP
jgi:hypothetical protein